MSSLVWQSRTRASLAALDPHLEPAELLKRFLSPLDVDEFMRLGWVERAVHVPGPEGRVRKLISEFFHDLDLPAMVSSSPSERVHAWLHSAGSGEGPESSRCLDSVAVDEAAALGLARAGAALYFRAPDELEELLVPSLATALASSCAARYPGDARPRGEIETFVANKGHVTGWHTDFQHNFTIQLRGSKRWRFKRGPVPHNLRALTPHYKTRTAYEQQMKVHLTSDPSSPEFRPPDEFFEGAEEVTVSPGDVLYHPAGIWHHVEVIEGGSVSINVSLTFATWAELIGSGVQQLLWTSPALRAPLVGLSRCDAYAAAEALLVEARRQIGALRAEDLLPPAMLSPQRPARHVNLGTYRCGSVAPLAPTDRYRFSRLAVLVRLPDQSTEGPTSSSSEAEPNEEHGSDSEVKRNYYALHVNFGNEDMSSWLRVRFEAPAKFVASIEWLCERHLSARKTQSLFRARVAHVDHESFLGEEILLAGSGARTVARLLKVLCHFGYLNQMPVVALPAKRVRQKGKVVAVQSRPRVLLKRTCRNVVRCT